MDNIDNQVGHKLVLMQEKLGQLSQQKPRGQNFFPEPRFIIIVAPQNWKQRRQWHPTVVLLPGKSHGQRSLEGCCLWGCIQSDTTERLHFHFSFFMLWRRKWQPTPVFLPGESQGRGNLVVCHLWGRTESDTTEATQQQQQQQQSWKSFWTPPGHNFLLPVLTLSRSIKETNQQSMHTGYEVQGQKIEL